MPLRLATLLLLLSGRPEKLPMLLTVAKLCTCGTPPAMYGAPIAVPEAVRRCKREVLPPPKPLLPAAAAAAEGGSMASLVL